MVNSNFGNFGNFGFPDMNMPGTMPMPMGGGFGMGMGGPGMGTFGYGFPGDMGMMDAYMPGWNNSTSSSSSDSQLSYEEKKAKDLERQKFQKDFNKLKQLLTSLYQNEDILTSVERDSLKYDVDHHSASSGKNAQENYDYLKGLYTQYKDTITSNISKLCSSQEDMKLEMISIGMNPDKKDTEKFNTILEGIETFLKSDDPENKGGIEGINEQTVLYLFASWNAKNPDKHLMHEMVKAAENASVDKLNTLSDSAKHLKEALISKADKFLDSAKLGEENKKALELAKNGLKDLDFADGETFADKFDELYRAARRAGAEIIQASYSENYEFLGEDNPFNNLVAKTEEELKKEGKMKNSAEAFKELPINEQLNKLVETKMLTKSGDTYKIAGLENVSYKIEDGKLKEIANGKSRTIDTAQLYEIGKLVQTNYLKPVGATEGGIVMFQETLDNNNGVAKLYYIDGKGQLRESTGYKVENGKLVKVNTPKTKDAVVKIGDIAKNVRQTLENDTQITDGSGNAATLLDKLKGFTSENDWVPMLEMIGYTNDGDKSWDDKGRHWKKTNPSQITPQNVLTMLKAYNADGSRDFFHQLEREGNSNHCSKQNREGILAYEVSNSLLTFINIQLLTTKDDNLKAKLNDTKALIEEFHTKYNAGPNTAPMQGGLAEKLDASVNALAAAYEAAAQSQAQALAQAQPQAQQTTEQQQAQTQEQTQAQTEQTNDQSGEIDKEQLEKDRKSGS